MNLDEAMVRMVPSLELHRAMQSEIYRLRDELQALMLKVALLGMELTAERERRQALEAERERLASLKGGYGNNGSTQDHGLSTTD